jgi:D-3-phosphoglycerate dehydrogenase / 2-oxoglutarate reductase
MKILVVGDSFVTIDDFQKAFSEISKSNDVRFIKIDETASFKPSSESDRRIKEYLGSPDQLTRELGSSECLVVHGAPVTEAVLDSSKNLKIICCARGGPVNVDAFAATGRRIPIVTAPGKNADAVADLAIAFLIMLSRNLVRALDHVRTVKVVGADNYEGNQFFGHELGSKVLGLIGYGRVGSKVAVRALSFGMKILVYDPFLDRSSIEAPGVIAADIRTVLSSSDYVSLHARESKENENLIGKKEFALMKQNAFFINTARPSMVDEAALYESLKNGQIAGAAMDVLKYDQARPTNPLLTLNNVIVTPHIGGATYETTTKGAEIVAKQLQRYLSGLPLETVINPEVLSHKS